MGSFSVGGEQVNNAEGLTVSPCDASLEFLAQVPYIHVNFISEEIFEMVARWNPKPILNQNEANVSSDAGTNFEPIRRFVMAEWVPPKHYRSKHLQSNFLA